MPLVSIIVPVLNESASIEKTLTYLKPALQHGHELIIVDGGSSDDTLEKCKQYTDRIFSSPKGRAMQMNLGANRASNNILVFLHADTQVPQNFTECIVNSLMSKQYYWGFFKVKLSGKHLVLKLISYFMNLRSCLSGIATGDQAIFISKTLFETINGFKEIPLMEDIELSRLLKKHSRPCCINSCVTTSSRKWENEGVLKTVYLMWKIRLLYFFGMSSDKLVKIYYK